MAACIMSPLSLYLLGCFFQVLIQGQVFRTGQTQDVFLRSKRANMYLVEEILQGNLERECYEEQCSYEEARECFEDTDKTIAFWTVYYDGDQCEPNPCLNGGNCTDKVGGFLCSCFAPNYGPVCELGTNKPLTAPQVVAKEIFECASEGPTACHQLCSASDHSTACSCLSGFTLHRDGRSCTPDVEFPCGRLPEQFNASMCRHGNCPWQVPLVDSGGVELCAGVLLGRRSVLTSAQCLFNRQTAELRSSNIYVVAAGNQKTAVPVRSFQIHKHFRFDNLHDNDLALLELAKPLTFSRELIHLCLPNKDFSEHVLMQPGNKGLSSTAHSLKYMTLDECRAKLNLSHPLSNKMFCMRSEGESETGASRKQNGALESRHYVPTQNGTADETENNNSNKSRKIESSAKSIQIQNQNQRCDVVGGVLLLPGTPVATVNKGTAFLTGLVTSRSADCGGLAFTKLSRFLTWIKPRLDASENRLSHSQVREYPEKR